MKKKERIFTFKVDEDLAGSLDEIANKSAFIRRAVEEALGRKCPLCGGTGALSPAQDRHLREFLTLHPLEKCEQCDAVHFVCRTDSGSPLH